MVVLHRVVCCYPDYNRLLAEAADHARRLVVYSYPPRNLASRAAFACQNALFRLSRRTFRAFTHPPEAMSAVVESRGFSPAYLEAGAWWRVAGLVRTAPS